MRLRLYTSVILTALASSARTLTLRIDADSSNYSAHAQAAIKTLLSLYDPSTGLWQTQWWNSANSLNTLADYHSTEPGFSSTAIPVYESTFKNAQTTTKQAFGHPLPGFKNSFYDDMGWWALAWIKVSDVTGNKTYLDMAESIFQNQLQGVSNQCGGGIYEDTSRKTINAIPTELFISTAAHLANRVPAKKQTYLGYAQKQWEWLSKSSLVNSDGLIQDNLDASTCKVSAAVWSYNQGVILGGLGQLYQLTKDASYISRAGNLATTFIKKYGKDDILQEFCSPKCQTTTGDMFKGIFIRNLGALVKSHPDQFATLKQIVLKNAQAVWDNARTSSGQFKDLWTPNNDGTVDYDGTTAATDALVAGVVVNLK